jgi:hypothetical protein
MLLVLQQRKKYANIITTYKGSLNRWRLLDPRPMQAKLKKELVWTPSESGTANLISVLTDYWHTRVDSSGGGAVPCFSQ